MSETSTSQPSSVAPGVIVAPLEDPAPPEAGRINAWPWRIIATVVSIVVVGGAAWWVTNSPLFDLRTLRVTGNHHLSAGQIARLGRLDHGTNVLWLPSGAIAHRIEADPWVRSVHVSRVLPSTVSVSVEERTPVALAGGEALLVADDGMILGPASKRERLPSIDGPSKIRIGSRVRVSPELEVARVFPTQVRRLVERVTVYGPNSLTLRLRDGVRAIFGDATAAAAKTVALQAVLAWANGQTVTPDYIDLRAPDVPALLPAGLSSPPEGSGTLQVPSSPAALPSQGPEKSAKLAPTGSEHFAR